MRTSLLASIVVCLLAGAVLAADSAAFDGKVVTVSVFKNGYGFFRMEGTADGKDGKVEISPVPAATLGTWWFYVRKDGASIDQAVAAQREVTKPRASPLSRSAYFRKRRQERLDRNRQGQVHRHARGQLRLRSEATDRGHRAATL